MNGAERREFVRTHRTCIFGYPRKAHGPSMSCVYYHISSLILSLCIMSFICTINISLYLFYCIAFVKFIIHYSSIPLVNFLRYTI